MPRKVRKKRKFLRIVFILIFAYTFWVVWKFPSTALDPENLAEQNFIIPKGSSLNKVAEKLEDEGLVTNARLMKIWLSYQESEMQIQAGTFPLSPSKTPVEIMETIRNPRKRISFSFTIPEGYTIDQIDEKLAKMELINRNEFYNCAEHSCQRKNYPEIPQSGSLEGYIFPDTYFLNPQTFEPQVLLDKALNNFHKKWDSIAKSNKRNPKDVVIMASLIEKEVRTDGDRDIVAGILWKRLNSGWALGVDATTVYATGRNQITKKDLQEDSPYNTRRKRGLPPTAIANPGLASLKAAMYDKSSNYWFYLTEPTEGRVIYSRSNEEHNQNRAKYLR